MEQEVLNKISYGLYVVTANQEGKDNGCVVDTVMQVAKEPQIISFSVYKTSYTCEMIQNTRMCCISVLNEDAQMELLKRFGYESGRDIDKFSDFTSCRKAANGTMIITEGTNAYFTVDINQQIDLGSHILFIGEPKEGEIFNDVSTMTYAYYAENKK